MVTEENSRNLAHAQLRDDIINRVASAEAVVLNDGHAAYVHHGWPFPTYPISIPRDLSRLAPLAVCLLTRPKAPNVYFPIDKPGRYDWLIRLTCIIV